MTTAVDERKMVIVMKTGLVFWVRGETGKKAQMHLESQTAHSFIRITELGETINTAEIAGIHNPETYDELNRYKAGDYKCQWGKWHEKRQRCDCAVEVRKAHEEAKNKAERDAANKPPTPEEKARTEETLRKNREILESRGVIGKTKRVYTLRRSALNEYQAKHGSAYPIPKGATIEEDVPLTT